MADAILTLDLGTSALKATLFDLDGAVLARGAAEVPTVHPREGWAEQDPDAWWEAARTAVAALKLAGAAGAGRRILAIGLTSQREGIVPVGRDGRPLARCIIWLDRRAQAEAEELGRQFPDLHQRTGMVPEATFTAGKVLWLRRHEPDILRRAAWLLQPRDYLYLRLAATALTDPSLASRTMFYDLRRRRWAEDVLEAVGIRSEQLPPVHPSIWAPGRLTREAAADLGLTDGLPVVAGGGDRPCEVLGAGATERRAMESSGTATNLSLPGPLPETIPEGVLISAHVVPGQFIWEQGMAPSGAILQWVGALLSPSTQNPAEGETDLTGRAAASAAGARGLLFLPHPQGARAPWWNPRARAAWWGLTLDHTPDDLARSVLEAIGFEGRGALEVLARAGRPVDEVILAGGSGRSRVWAAIKASIWNRPVILPRHADAASLGAMLLAGAARGVLALDDAARLNPPTARIDPDPALAAQYEEIYAAYRQLYARLEVQ
jgi:xylulokinase